MKKQMFMFAAVMTMFVSSAKAALPDPNLLVNTQSRQTALNNGSALGGGCPLTKGAQTAFNEDAPKEVVKMAETPIRATAPTNKIQ